MPKGRNWRGGNPCNNNPRNNICTNDFSNESRQQIRKTIFDTEYLKVQEEHGLTAVKGINTGWALGITRYSARRIAFNRAFVTMYNYLKSKRDNNESNNNSSASAGA